MSPGRGSSGWWLQFIIDPQVHGTSTALSLRQYEHGRGIFLGSLSWRSRTNRPSMSRCCRCANGRWCAESDQLLSQLGIIWGSG